MATEWFEKAKQQAEAKAKQKTADGKKEKKGIKGFFKGIGRFFKELKSEFKKVVWPSKKDIGKNTVAVIGISLAVGIFIWCVDAIFSLLVALVF